MALFVYTRVTFALVHSHHMHHMNLFKCHSENPSRHNSLDDLMGDRPLSDSEAGTSMFLLSEVCDVASVIKLWDVQFLLTFLHLPSASAMSNAQASPFFKFKDQSCLFDVLVSVVLVQKIQYYCFSLYLWNCHKENSNKWNRYNILLLIYAGLKTKNANCLYSIIYLLLYYFLWLSAAEKVIITSVIITGRPCYANRQTAKNKRWK